MDASWVNCSKRCQGVLNNSTTRTKKDIGIPVPHNTTPNNRLAIYSILLSINSTIMQAENMDSWPNLPGQVYDSIGPNEVLIKANKNSIWENKNSKTYYHKRKGGSNTIIFMSGKKHLTI